MDTDHDKGPASWAIKMGLCHFDANKKIILVVVEAVVVVVVVVVVIVVVVYLFPTNLQYL